MYSTGKLASIVGCATKTIRQKAANNEIPIAKMNNDYRYFDDDAIRAYYRSINLNACNLVKDSSSDSIRKVRNLVLCSDDRLKDYTLYQYILGTVDNTEVEFIKINSLTEFVNELCKKGVFDKLYLVDDIYSVSSLEWLFTRLGVELVDLSNDLDFDYYSKINEHELIMKIARYQVKKLYEYYIENHEDKASDIFKTYKGWLGNIDEFNEQFLTSRYMYNLVNCIENTHELDNIDFIIPDSDFKFPDSVSTRYTMNRVDLYSNKSQGLFSDIAGVYSLLFKDKSYLYNIDCINFNN